MEPMWLVALGALCGMFAAGSELPPRWTARPNWQRVQPNMTTSEVYHLLGEPTETLERPNWTVWAYQDPCPKSPDGAVIGLPADGFIRFITAERDPRTGRPLPAALLVVEQIREPDWSRVATGEPEDEPSPAPRHRSRRWTLRANWLRVQPNMTPGQVRQWLGEPLEKVQRAGWAAWSYQDPCPRSEDGTITGLPTRGFVRFIAVRQDPATGARLAEPVFVVERVYEPDWSRVQAEGPVTWPADESSLESPIPPWQMNTARRRAPAPEDTSPKSPPPWAAARPPRPDNGEPAAGPAPEEPSFAAPGTAFFCIAGGIMFGMAVMIALRRGPG